MEADESHKPNIVADNYAAQVMSISLDYVIHFVWMLGAFSILLLFIFLSFCSKSLLVVLYD